MGGWPVVVHVVVVVVMVRMEPRGVVSGCVCQLIYPPPLTYMHIHSGQVGVRRRGPHHQGRQDRRHTDGAEQAGRLHAVRLGSLWVYVMVCLIAAAWSLVVFELYY